MANLFYLFSLYFCWTEASGAHEILRKEQENNTQHDGFLGAPFMEEAGGNRSREKEGLLEVSEIELVFTQNWRFHKSTKKVKRAAASDVKKDLSETWHDLLEDLKDQAHKPKRNFDEEVAKKILQVFENRPRKTKEEKTKALRGSQGTKNEKTEVSYRAFEKIAELNTGKIIGTSTGETTTEETAAFQRIFDNIAEPKTIRNPTEETAAFRRIFDNIAEPKTGKTIGNPSVEKRKTKVTTPKTPQFYNSQQATIYIGLENLELLEYTKNGSTRHLVKLPNNQEDTQVERAEPAEISFLGKDGNLTDYIQITDPDKAEDVANIRLTPPPALQSSSATALKELKKQVKTAGLLGKSAGTRNQPLVSLLVAVTCCCSQVLKALS